MSPLPQYGSINNGGNDEVEAAVELLPHPSSTSNGSLLTRPHSHSDEIRNVLATRNKDHNSGNNIDDGVNGVNNGGNNGAFALHGSVGPTAKENRWTKHHCVSYTIAALICLFSARYWHGRAESFSDGDGGGGGVGGGVSGGGKGGVSGGVSGGGVGGGFDIKSIYDRVPMPPALSTLDPFADLGFRVTTRTGVAAPSKAWGKFFLGGAGAGAGDDDNGGGYDNDNVSKDSIVDDVASVYAGDADADAGDADDDRRLAEAEAQSTDSGSSSAPFIPLPTNQWYLNLLSHRAAEDPAQAGEISHVYTIPYVVGVSPPNPDPTPDDVDDDVNHEPDANNNSNNNSNSNNNLKQTMAGIELFLPVMKTTSTNIQMIFDKYNGVALGAIVPQAENENVEEGDALTSYEVDPDEPISPLGVSLRWKYVDMKTHIVRGMPYGTVRFGTGATGSGGKSKSKTTATPVLPTIVAGNMPRSILIDSHVTEDTADIVANVENTDSTPSTGSNSKRTMLCGSLTGTPITQDPNHHAPISTDGKAHAYHVQKELMFHLDQSDFTWVVFFSKPVRVKCYSDAVPAVSVPGANREVQFRLDVVGVVGENGGENGNEKGDEENGGDSAELVVRMALLNECTTGKSIIKQHCDHLAELGYDTVSSTNESERYLEVLREGANVYPKSPLVGTRFPEEEEDENDDENEDGRVTNIIFDWDPTSIYGGSLFHSDSVTGLAPDASKDVPEEEVTVAAASGLRASKKLTDIAAASTSSMASSTNELDGDGLLMFALPHHLQSLSSSSTNTDATDADATTSTDYSSLCIHTFHGRTCLVKSSKWILPVRHGEPQSFLADRPPTAKAIPQLAEALKEDVKFKLSPNVLRGAADTYFPAKILAKVGRIIEITQELRSLQSGHDIPTYTDADETTVQSSRTAAAQVTIPSEEEVESLLDDLQRAVQIWLEPGGKEGSSKDGTSSSPGGEAEFLYDATWGGFVNCGCKYSFDEGKPGDGTCANSFPECPALEDVNEDFGNGWYNDHHFHYGYHIYAAAIVAKHRPEWGTQYFERVLLYIRDIANPSAHDPYFPMYRQKDFYLGNSWASGLMSMELSPHGREQESSSEAIAAFEGIALYGNVMMDAFAGDDENLATARLVRNLGEFLTSMEVEATRRFWHVWGSADEGDSTTSTSVLSPSKTNNDTGGSSTTATTHINDYPSAYDKPVVGMMHETMASFQTWFAPQEVVSYGIQLMPLTSVAERRDDPEWTSILYPAYAQSCKDANEGSDNFCEKNGWSILQAGLLAETMGDDGNNIDDALELASNVPKDVYTSDGACGNSLSNTIWFISTRKASSSSSESMEERSST